MSTSVRRASTPPPFVRSLSGMVVLKQETEAVEWFEPLLSPWTHYIPVSASLHNLSDAVRWVRANPSRARAIVEPGAQMERAPPSCFLNKVERSAPEPELSVRTAWPLYSGT